MAHDLKIEIFAHKLFHRLWYTLGEIEFVPDIREIYGDECVVDESYLEACNDLFINAAYFRGGFLGGKYMSSVSYEEMENFKTLSELYDYIIRMCDRDDLFGHLTVFERMLATSDFVASICYRYRTNTDSPIDVIMYGYILWSMYFDKFTEEFYEKGGWNQLKREVKCYELFSEFETIFCTFSVFGLQAIKEATVNFSYFKNAVSYQEQKHQHPVHISVLWIKFRIEHFESYINIPLNYQTSVSAYEADLLLDDLKLILDPTRCKPDALEISKEKQQSRAFSTEMSYSEIPSTFGERKVNHDDETQIQYSDFEHEIRSIDKVSDEFSQISTHFKESQIICQTSAKEELAFDVIGPKENLGLVENTFTEMKQMRQTSRLDNKYSHNEQNLIAGMQRSSETSIKNLSTTSAIDSDLICRNKWHMNKTEDSTIDYFYKGNAEKCDEIINTDEVISTLQLEETKYQRISSPKNDANSRDLGSINEIVNSVNKLENSKFMVEMSSCSKTGRTEIVKSMDNSSKSKIIAHERNGKITSKDLPTLKDSSSINKNANNDDEIRRVKIAWKELREEQSDHEVKNFLRMLLVLGDMEGTEFVLSTLQNIEESPETAEESPETAQESPETAQESSNKQKKKPKTKGTEFERSTLKNNQEYPEKSKESLNIQKKRSKKKKPKK